MGGRSRLATSGADSDAKADTLSGWSGNAVGTTGSANVSAGVPAQGHLHADWQACGCIVRSAAEVMPA